MNHFIQAIFIRPKIRPYQTNNYYAALMREMKAEKEVKEIVRISKERKEIRSSVAGTSDEGRKKKG